MLAPADQANLKKSPTTGYIISIYKVTLSGSCSQSSSLNAFPFLFACRFSRAMTVKGSSEIGFIGQVKAFLAQQFTAASRRRHSFSVLIHSFRCPNALSISSKVGGPSAYHAA